MAQPYVGEIRMFAGNFPPQGWEFCSGQLLPISENDTLFNLIGTTYGGDGQSTFALPDLRGRVPIHMGNSFVIGQSGGVEEVTLTVNQLPAHSHAPMANTGNGTTTNPASNVWAAQPAMLPYSAAGTANINLRNTAISLAGGSQPHNNMMPYLGIDYIISLFGIFPSQG